MPNMRWQAPMVRIIFDVIDECKGANSIFISDLPGGIAKIKKRLKNVTDDKNQYDAITSDQISGKLQKQLVKAGLSFGQRREFFVQGTTSIDISKLDTGVYSEKEIKKRSAKVKRKADQAEEAGDLELEHNKVRSSKSRTLETRKDIDIPDDPAILSAEKSFVDERNQDVQRPRPARIIFSVKPKDHAAIPSQPRSRHRIPQPENSQCELCGRNFLSLQEFNNHRIVHFEQTLPYKIIPCLVEGCRAYFGLQEDLDAHYAMHDEVDVSAESATPRGDQNESEAVADGDTIHLATPSMDAYTSGERELITFMDRNEAALPADLPFIRAEMKHMQNKIFSHTIDLFREVQYDESAQPDVVLQGSEPSLVHLLTTLFGTRIAGHVSLRLCQPASNDYLQASELVMALVGSALTEWTLKPVPQSEIADNLFQHYTKILAEKSPSLHDRIMELATATYLEENVKPEIPRTATRMSAKLVRMLRPVLETLQPLENTDFKKTQIIAVPNSAEKTNPFEDDTEWPFYPHLSGPHVRFANRLAAVFEQALTLRVRMEEFGHARYKFSLPQENNSFDFRIHTALDKSNNLELSKVRICEEDGFDYDNQEDDLTPGRAIKVALFPDLRASFKHTRDGPWRDDVLVAKADVLIWQKAKEVDDTEDEEHGPGNVQLLES